MKLYLRRVLSLILAVVMVFAMMPAFAQQADALSSSDFVDVGVVDAGGLKACLSSETNYRIKLLYDIDYKDNGNYQYWCTIAGNKILDLNGHSIEINNEGYTKPSILFNVPYGATLVITADPDADLDDVKITYNGYMNENAEERVRHLFDVCGTLIVNGGNLEAGRSKKASGNSAVPGNFFISSWQQIPGSAVIVEPNGTLIVNGGRLAGRYEGRHYTYFTCCAAIYCYSDSNVYFNNGIAEGRGGANVFYFTNKNDRANIVISGGHFETHGLEAWDSMGAWEEGEMGLTNADLASGSTFSPDSGHGDVSGYDNLTVYPDPKGGSLELSVPSGTLYTSEESGGSYYLVDEDRAIIKSAGIENYFGGYEGLEYCGIEHKTRYYWTLKDGDTVIGEISGNSLKQVNLTSKNYWNFTPEYNHIYTISLTTTEYLTRDGENIAVFKRSGESADVAIRSIHTEDIAINETNFPDPYFRQYVLDYIDTNGDNWLNQTERANTDRISLNNYTDNRKYSNVQSVKGIEYLYQVNYVYAYNTKLTSFDGTGLPYLMELDLGCCPLDSLNIKNNRYLRYLNLSDSTGGSLNSIDLSGNPNLRILETYRSNISEMDISCCKWLVEAALYGEVKKLTYSNGNVYAWVHELPNNCYFTNDGYDSNVTIAHFDEAFPSVSLRKIIMNNRNFNWDLNNDLSISEAKDIEILDLNGEEEELTTLEGLEFLPNLWWLDAGDCRIESADLTKNTKLKELYLNGNYVLKEVNLSGLTSLETLWLGNNDLDKVDLSGLTALTDLDVSENNLKTLDISDQVNLLNLNAGYNNLSRIDVRANKNLTDLSVDNNRLHDIDVSNNTSLKYLRIVNNAIEDLDITTCPNLTRLDCYGNKIYLLDISACSDLVTTHREGTYSLQTLDSGFQYRRHDGDSWSHSLSYDLITFVYNGIDVHGVVASITTVDGDMLYYHFSNAAAEANGRTINLLNDAEEYEMSIDEVLKVKLNGYNLPLKGPDGYAVKETRNSSGVSTFTVVKAAAAVIRIFEGEAITKYYETFAEALGAAYEDEIIVLLADVSATYTLAVGETLNLDKNGYSIKIAVPDGYILTASETSELHGTVTYTIYSTTKAVAQVGSKLYALFEKAVKAANGEVITLLDDIDAPYVLSVGETLKVKKNGHSLTVKAPDYYTVSATTDSDGVTTYTVKEIAHATFNGASLSLKDKISINAYMIIPEDAEGWKVNVYYEKDNTDSELYQTPRYTYELRKDGGYYSGFYSAKNDEYKIMFPDIAAKELTEDVRIVIVDGEGNYIKIKYDTDYIDFFDYCAADWANTMIAKPDAKPESKVLAKALLNFGGEAQKYFDYKTELNANPEGYLASEMTTVTADTLKDFAGVTDDNAAAVGLEESPLSLSLKSETYLNIYFYNSVTATAENLDKAVMKVSKSGSEWVAKITGITAKNLGRQYTLTVKGNSKTSTLKYSALSWAYSVLEKGTNAKAMELAKALYLYQQAAAAYFN